MRIVLVDRERDDLGLRDKKSELGAAAGLKIEITTLALDRSIAQNLRAPLIGVRHRAHCGLHGCEHRRGRVTRCRGQRQRPLAHIRRFPEGPARGCVNGVWYCLIAAVRKWWRSASVLSRSVSGKKSSDFCALLVLILRLHKADILAICSDDQPLSPLSS